MPSFRFFPRSSRQRSSVPGLDDPPPSPARPDGAAVARERVEQVIGGGIGGCVTPRRGAGAGDEPHSSSSGTSEVRSENDARQPLAPGASDEGGGEGAGGGALASFSTPTTMAPLSVEGGAGAGAEKNETGSRRQSGAAFSGLGLGTPGGWARSPSRAGGDNPEGNRNNNNDSRRPSSSSSHHRAHHHHHHSTRFSWREFAYMCGPGLLMAVAYLDPGNLEADIQAGAHVGYSLLWFVALAFVCGFAFQCMTARLGIVTGRDLAAVAGDSYPRGARILLWILLEVALVGADIQETIGSAIAIALLSGGKVPLWGGCLLITAAAFIVLLLERCGARHLEAVFGGLIAMQGLSAGVNYIQAGVPQREVLRGLFIPRMPAAAVPFAVGALGALVMPHNIYFASALASTSRPDVVPKGTAVVPTNNSNSASSSSEGGPNNPSGDGTTAAAAAATTTTATTSVPSSSAVAVTATPSTPTVLRRAGSIGSDDANDECSTPIVAALAPSSSAPSPSPLPSSSPTNANAALRKTVPQPPSSTPSITTTTTGLSTSRTRVLLRYARLEAGIVLIGAFCINLFVVCLFAHGFYGTPEAKEVGLASAGAYLGERFGALFKYLWAVGLLASGLSATITLTYAGQIVMAGLLRFEVASWRRLLGTRAVALVPTVTIAAVFEGTGSSRRFDGMNQLLNVLQAMVLPFSLVPVIALTASPAVIPHLPFRTRGLLLAFACSVAALVAAIDGYLVVDFVKELGAGNGAATWAGLICLLGGYYALILYFAVGPVRVERAARSAAAAAIRAGRRVAGSVKGTKWNDAGAMMEVHL